MKTVSSPIYQGQYGTFTITKNDRLEVITYRLGLWLAGLSWIGGSSLILWQGATSTVLNLLTYFFWLFALGLGMSLMTIHIYLKSLHQVLQLFWLIGVISAVIFVQYSYQPLALFVYEYSPSLLAIGFIFASLTGIFVKEAFCFNRLESKFLTLIFPSFFLAHLFHLLSVNGAKIFLTCISCGLLIFLVRKAIQPIPPDIGDKSVFEHLKNNISE